MLNLILFHSKTRINVNVALHVLKVHLENYDNFVYAGHSFIISNIDGQ